MCSATTRLLVEESFAPALEAALAKHAAKVRCGHPLELETRLGPVVNRAQHDKVRRCIREAKEDGARLLCGGGDPPGLPAELAGGYFTAPTIFCDVTPDMRLWREEAHTFCSCLFLLLLLLLGGELTGVRLKRGAHPRPADPSLYLSLERSLESFADRLLRFAIYQLLHRLQIASRCSARCWQ